MSESGAPGGVEQSKQGGAWAPRPQVAAFARLMEAKLREHDDRPGWQTDARRELFARLVEEAGEVDEALDRLAVLEGRRLDSFEDGLREKAFLLDKARAHVAEEAADVANFAMMIADVLGALDAEPGDRS